MQRHFAWVLFLLGLCVGPFWEGPVACAEPPVSTTVVRLSGAPEPAHLNPLLDPDVGGYRISHDVVCEPLVRRKEHDGQTTYEPVLADRYRLDRDGRTFDVWLRKGVRFHDGRVLSSYDVQLSLQMVLSTLPASSETRALLRNVVSIHRTGPDALRLVLRRGTEQILWALSELPIVPAAHFPDGRLVQKPWNRKPICTGPYRVAEWKRGVSLVLKRNPTYWGAAPAAEELRFLFSQDPAKAFHWFRSGQAEVLLRVPLRYLPDLVEPALQRGRFSKLVPDGKQLVTLLYSGRHPLLGQAAVRQAVSGFLDRAQFLADVRSGLGSLDVPLPVPEKRAQEDAEKRLDQSQITRAAPGSARLFGGKLVTWKLVVPQGSAELRELATRLVSALGKLGIKLVPELVEFSAFPSRLRLGSFDLALVAWNFTGPDRLLDPEPVLRAAYPANHPLWNQLSARLADWQLGGDPEPLRKIWEQEQPATVLYRPNQLFLFHPGLVFETHNGFVNLRTLRFGP
ncbi:MAG TPA: ABC transporter substrate-binding protein [Pseudomonadota bacterium]|nr:ABC transporter substrate-binding protein [Pseudomonadota bacterium]